MSSSSPQVVDYLATRHPEQIARFRSLLAEHFDRIGRVDDYRWLVYDIYVRRAKSRSTADRAIAAALRSCPPLRRTDHDTTRADADRAELEQNGKVSQR